MRREPSTCASSCQRSSMKSTAWKSFFTVASYSTVGALEQLLQDALGHGAPQLSLAIHLADEVALADKAATLAAVGSFVMETRFLQGRSAPV